MKKLLILTLCVIMLLSLFACEPAKPGTSEDESKAQTSETSEETSETASEASEPDTRTALKKQTINWRQLKDYETMIDEWRFTVNDRDDCETHICAFEYAKLINAERFQPGFGAEEYLVRFDKLTDKLTKAGLHDGSDCTVAQTAGETISYSEFRSRVENGYYSGDMISRLAPAGIILSSGVRADIYGGIVTSMYFPEDSETRITGLKEPEPGETELDDEAKKAVADFISEYTNAELKENSVFRWTPIDRSVVIIIDDNDEKRLLRGWYEHVQIPSDLKTPDITIEFGEFGVPERIMIFNKEWSVELPECESITPDEAWDNVLAGRYEWLGAAAEKPLDELTVLNNARVLSEFYQTEKNDAGTTTSFRYVPYYEFMIYENETVYTIKTPAYAE